MTTSSTTYSAVWSTVLQGRVVDHCEFRIHSHVAFQVAFAAVVDKRAIAPPPIFQTEVWGSVTICALAS